MYIFVAIFKAESKQGKAFRFPMSFLRKYGP